MPDQSPWERQSSVQIEGPTKRRRQSHRRERNSVAVARSRLLGVQSRLSASMEQCPWCHVRCQPSNCDRRDDLVIACVASDFPPSSRPWLQVLCRFDRIPSTLYAAMYKRVLLKISGEALAAGRGFGVDAVFIHEIANEIAQVARTGCQIAIVVGGGNFFRGVSEQAIHMDRVAADHMGMLSTVINALALQDAIEKTGLYARVMSAIE